MDILLKHHADVNKTTPARKDDVTDCSGAPSITGRTALMYAAENASSSVIAALLKAQTNPKAIDSAGYTAKDHLAKNELISDDGRKKIEGLLQK